MPPIAVMPGLTRHPVEQGRSPGRLPLSGAYIAGTKVCMASRNGPTEKQNIHLIFIQLDNFVIVF